MHSMPCVALHPDSQMAAFQGIDNQILLYGMVEGNYKLNRSKRYMGHLVAGSVSRL
jgi:pre-mRNA-processing factor 17